MDLSIFNTASLFDAATDLFKQLGVKTNSNTTEPLPIESVLKEHLRETSTFKAIEKTYFIGLIDNEVISSSNGLFEYKISYDEAQQKINNEYKGLMIFAVNINNTHKPTANQLRDITRAFNRISEQMPVVVIYKTGNTISFSNCERIKFRQVWRKGEKIGKVSVLYDVNVIKPHQGHIRILKSLAVEEIKKYDKRNKVESFNDLHRAWTNVFNTDVLNKQFYLDYQKLSVKLINAIYPEQIENKLTAHQGVLNLLNRVMFLYFVQKKEWIMNDENFIIHFWNDYKETGKLDVFHEEWLNSIFFSAFNGIAYRDPKAIKALPEPYKSEIINFPFLNGGLFSYNKDFDNFLLPDIYFENIFDFFESYIFTISEDTPYDVNLEINPELLGKMYEGMINATDLDDVDAENGIVYTERAEINFMTRRSFVEVLDKKLDGSLSREFLYHFIFDEPEQKKEILNHYKPNIERIRQVITSITACDSACGSGSMILGVIQLQMELLRTLDNYVGKPHSAKDDFIIKKQLISECIYGVDIKEWAVRIAELRLWLYMISEAEFSKDELIKTPLLPNLDFKLRKGDSLIQKIGSLDFSLEELLKGRKITSGATKQLNDFIKKKKDFITNQNESDTTYVKLKAEEYSVFMNFIQELIIENDIRLKNLGKREKQISMFAEPEQAEIDMYAEEKEEIKNEIEKLKRLKETIHKDERLPFGYDIDFMEIFLTREDAGFDLIISNPPYVRQEEILPPEDGEYLEYLLKQENREEKTKINKEYKATLNEKVFKTYPFLNSKVKTQIEGKIRTIPVYGNKVPGRSDLYCYFQLLCPAYLNSKGTLCFIISNSWLDVEYGSFVQLFLLKHTDLKCIYDSNVRSFDASINTIIYIHSALRNHKESRETFYKTLKPENNSVQFVMNKIDYAQAAYAPLLLEQENCRKNTFKDLYRVITLTQNELFNAGYEEERAQYSGDKWGGKYLRAPEIYYTVLKKGQSKFIPLKTLADVRFGIKTGANEFFYLPNKYFELEDKKQFWKLIPKDASCPTGLEIEKELLKPILFSLKEVDFPELSKGNFEISYLSSSLPKSKLGKVKEYIIWGEKQGFHRTPTCSNRNPYWYSIDDNFYPAAFIFPSKIGERFMLMDNRKLKILEDKKQYGVSPLEKFDLDMLFVYCNSSLYRFLVEQLSPQLTGAQAISDITTTVFKESPCIDFRKFQVKKFSMLPEFKYRKQESIFTELGFDKTKTIRDQPPNPLPDRKELDDIIFTELGLTQEERNEVYWSVAEFVKQRLDKAASR